MIELKGQPVADSIYAQIKSHIQDWGSLNWKPPSLAVVLVGEDEASQVYVHHKQVACEKLGFRSNLIKCSSQIPEEELIKKINELISDNEVDALLIQLPLPKHLNTKKILNLIPAIKDADGLTTASLGQLMAHEQLVASCTPQGILELLKYYQIQIFGKNILIMGRSRIVGMPLFHLLNQQNATVTLAHSKTENLKELIKNFEIVVVAIGKPHYFKATDFKKGATVIDVGIHRTENKIIGDVNPEQAPDHLFALTPVPGGVGKMTIAMLMHNTYVLAKQRRQSI